MDEIERDRLRRLTQRKIEALGEVARNLESLSLLARAEEEKARELERERADLALTGSRMGSEGGPAIPAEAEPPEGVPAPPPSSPRSPT